MAFDLDDAKRLIRQVRERSHGPGTTTLDDLAQALDAAVHEVNSLAGTVGALNSALVNQRAHATASVALGRELQATARGALHDAAAQERTALESLAALLEGATAQIAQLQNEAHQLAQDLTDARTEAAQDYQAHERELNTLAGELQRARQLATQQAAALTRLAALPWWKRVFHVE